MTCNYEVMATFKFVGQGQRSETVCMYGKVLSQALYMSNMKALSQIKKQVRGQGQGDQV